METFNHAGWQWISVLCVISLASKGKMSTIKAPPKITHPTTATFTGFVPIHTTTHSTSLPSSLSTPLLMSPTTTQTTLSNSTLICRKCTNAVSLDFCTTLIACSSDESCFIEQLVTEQLTYIYNAGCRAKDVCRLTSKPLVGKRDISNQFEVMNTKDEKRADLLSCRQCCDTDICNEHLCGISILNPNTIQCYHCKNGGSQSPVSRPEDCVTIATCQSDEVCFMAGYKTIGTGASEYEFSCQKKTVCGLIMKVVFQDHDRCEGVIDPVKCGNRRRTQVRVCNSCCGDDRCNVGTCHGLNERMYQLYKAGILDINTLKVMSNSTMAG